MTPRPLALTLAVAFLGGNLARAGDDPAKQWPAWRGPLATGVAPHGENGLEFVYMVEGGMPPMKAIQSATLVASQLIEREADLGTVEVGKLADLVAVPGNPLEDIRQMTNVTFVMKGGVVYKP